MTLPVSIVPRPTLQLSHHRIHEGNHFNIHKITTDLNLTITKYFLIIPPTIQIPPSATVEIHLTFEIVTDTGLQFEFFEDAAASNGSQIMPVNNNRNSPTSALTQVFEDPIVTSDGTKLAEERIGTATSGGTIGEADRDEDEFILKIGSMYLIKITALFPLGPQSTNITAELDWYDARPSSPIFPP